MSKLSGTVLITGANGFLGQHVIDQVLNETDLKVKAIIRSQSAAEALKKSFGKELEGRGRVKVAFVKDMTKAGAYDKVIGDADYVIHLASPLHDLNYSSDKVESQFLQPAIKGNERMLESAKKTPSVKKLVLFSSAVSMIGTKRSQLDENDWGSVDYEAALRSQTHRQAYVAATTLAEKAAWDFMEKHSPAFALTSLNPTMAVGPHLLPCAISGSNATLWKALSVDGEGPLIIGAVDVRDVAKAHLQALIRKDVSDGKRYLIHSGNPSPSQLIDIAHRRFPDHKVLWADPIVPIEPLASDAPVISYDKEALERSSKDLEIKFRSVEESVADLLDSTFSLEATLQGAR